MPFASKEKRNEYQREYKRKQAAELKRLRAQAKKPKDWVEPNAPINEGLV
jgi:hypothetical protein